jgi:hypothetical protein
MDFQPTYLMIKRHQVTGLMYFCKTSTRDPMKYPGSGKYWKDHLKVHGRLVDTLWHQQFEDKEDLVEFALFFSEFHDIVDAVDFRGKKIWANMIPENGLDGAPAGVKMPSTSRSNAIHKKGITPWNKGKATGPAPHISESNKRRKGLPSGRLGVSTSLKGTSQPVLVCPHCAKQGGVSGMKRYHFDNCKEKK